MLKSTNAKVYLLHKMRARLASPIAYFLHDLPLNSLLGKFIQLQFTGEIYCLACGRRTAKSFNQGYCFPCSQRLAQCDLCFVRPERCHFAQGTCRQPAWAETYCMQPHYVYLANSSGLKVGITRQNQAVSRWIDQGASQALPIFQMSCRYHAGLIEHCLAQQVADKTNWRQLLQKEAQPIDLTAERNNALANLAKPIAEIEEKFDLQLKLLASETVMNFHYPILKYPQRLKSLNLDKTPLIEGKLEGIKGQYLLLDSGVLNVRKFTGYQVSILCFPSSVC